MILLSAKLMKSIAQNTKKLQTSESDVATTNYERGVLVIKTAVLSGFRAKNENQLVIKTHFWAKNVQKAKKKAKKK